MIQNQARTRALHVFVILLQSGIQTVEAHGPSKPIKYAKGIIEHQSHHLGLKNSTIFSFAQKQAFPFLVELGPFLFSLYLNKIF